MGFGTPERPAAAEAGQGVHSPAAAAAANAVGTSEMMAAGSSRGELGVQVGGHAGLVSHAVLAGRGQQVWEPVPGLVPGPEMQLLLRSLQTMQHHEVHPFGQQPNQRNQEETLMRLLSRQMHIQSDTCRLPPSNAHFLVIFE